MTLADTAHGSDWILWVVFAVFVILTIVVMAANLFLAITLLQKKRKPDMMRKSCAVYTELEWA